MSEKNENSEVREYKDPKDYTLREKVIWKGKMAPKGWFYLVMDVNCKSGDEDKHGKYSKVQLMNRAVQGKAKEQVLSMMREDIHIKFGI